MASEEKVTLARTMGFFEATMIGLGAMIGAGIFVLTGLAAGEAGPAAILAFALNGLITGITAFTYAELASSIPEAGGGYAFVKQAFPGAPGFLSGWMLWFAYSVACALYAVGFGGYFLELLHSYAPDAAGLLTRLLGEQGAVAALTLAVSGFFITLNVIGADVTGKAENVITMAKLVILSVFAAAGIGAIFRAPEVFSSNFIPFLPNGLGGVLTTMGLTFIAFEGYDLIATVSEEIKNPRVNIPRATFTSLGVAVLIYLIIVLVSIGAVNPETFTGIFGKLPSETGLANPQVLDPGNPEINTSWEILGLYKETGIVRAAENFLPSVGVVMIVFGGLLSTMSALNATVLASSRVAFSMGREKMLPGLLAAIHPHRRTPQNAVLITGLIFSVMAVLLPIEVVGSASSVLFLLSFALVNASLIRLRRSRALTGSGFRSPLFPWLPAAGILLNLTLAAYQLTFQPLAWGVSLAWIGAGIIVYRVYTKDQIRPEYPTTVLMEERLTEREFTVMVPVSNPTTARLLGILGSILAGDREGEVLAVHVVSVPTQLSLLEGREELSRARQLMDSVHREADRLGVPVHKLVRLGRSLPKVLKLTAQEQNVNLMVTGWPKPGGITRTLAAAPPCDLVVARFGKREPPRRILIATRGGYHAPLALQAARSQAEIFQQETGIQPVITLFQVLPARSSGHRLKAAQERLGGLADRLNLETTIKITTAEDEYRAIKEELEDHNLGILHAPEAGLLEQRLFGTIPDRLAQETGKTLILVKRHHPLRSWLSTYFHHSPGEAAEETPH